MRIRRTTALLLLLLPIALGLSFASANPLLTAASLATVVLLAVLLYRPGEPPVLLFAAAMQWLQVAAKVAQADFKGVPVNQLQSFYGDLPGTILASLFGLLILAAGMRLGIGRLRLVPMQAAAEVALIPIARFWRLYLLGTAVSFLLERVAAPGSGLQQIILALASVKWAFLFLLVYAVMARSQGYLYLVLAIALEVVLGFTGFFGGFKTVFFIVLIGALTARVRVTPRLGIALGSLTIGLLFLSVTWSAIKSDYRAFVSGGSGQQEVAVPYAERMDYLIDKVGALRSEDLQRGTDVLLARVSYVDFLAAVFDYVPASEPHTYGARTGQAIVHVFTPRLLFPWKAPTEADSDVTRQYSGLYVSGEQQGTSISVGYFAECYIDFGKYFMFAPIFALGLLAGWMYRFLLTRKRNLLLTRFGLAVMVLFGLGTFETALIKLVGHLVTTFLAAWAISHFFARRLELGYLLKGKAAAAVGAHRSRGL